MKQVQSAVTYFAKEGRDNLSECVRLSFEAAVTHGIEKLVIFTARGQGVRFALDNFMSRQEYAHMKVIAVTFPQAFGGTSEIPDPTSKFSKQEHAVLENAGIRVVKAHMPFEPIRAQYDNRGLLAQDLSIVGNALNIFCGSMSLCIQGVLMACDAGEVTMGEPVVVLTSATSLIVHASTTANFLTDLIVRQLICKPAFLTIGKKERGLDEPVDTPEGNLLQGGAPKQLDSETDIASEISE